MKAFAACVLPLVVACSPALAGPDWLEVGDAGSIFATAQPVLGVGTPLKISGSLSLGASAFAWGGDPATLGTMADYEDLYLIRIEQPTTFSFSMVNASFDGQLYLFNVTLASQAFGLLGNQDTSLPGVTARITNLASDGTGAEVLNVGTYALGICGAGRTPVSGGGGLYTFASSTELSGPDGPGGLNAHTGWTGDGEVGYYEIDLEGVGYVDVPAPGVLGVFAAGALVAVRRRRADR